MLRRGSSVSSPSDEQDSKPAQDRKANTDAAISVPKGVSPGVKVLTTSMVCPFGALPVAARPKITAASTSIAAMPMPPISSSTLAATADSRMFSASTTAAPSRATSSQGGPLPKPACMKNASRKTPHEAIVQAAKKT